MLLKRTGRRYPRLIQTGANLFTMTMIGLWHGASWTFVVWGLWHGVLLSLEHLLSLKPTRRWTALVGGILTFHLIGAGWILFRSPSFTAAASFFRGLLAFEQMSWLGVYLPPVLVTAAALFAIDLFGSKRWQLPSGPIRQILIVAAIVLITSLALLSAARGGDARPFIYGVF
jgi:D-alanyl-lipoteichoic acid acyltransferase DltB (MBOAT superfamily)